MKCNGLIWITTFKTYNFYDLQLLRFAMDILKTWDCHEYVPASLPLSQLWIIAVKTPSYHELVLRAMRAIRSLLDSTFS